MTMSHDNSKTSATTWWQEDIHLKNKILEALQKKLNTFSPRKIEGLKYFLESCSGNRISTDEIGRIFQRAMDNTISSEEFREFFHWLSPLEAKLIAFNNNLGFTIWPEPAASTVSLKDDSMKKLEDYFAEGKISASVSLENAGGSLKSIPPSAPYAIHSVAKIFTGILALEMMDETKERKRVFPETMLDQPIKDLINDEAWNLLPLAVREHLEVHRITLFELMTHLGGIGDYGYDKGNGSYCDALAKQGFITGLTDIKNFLRFAEEKTYKAREFHYSNLGITLVGLALENTYKKYCQENNLPQIDFMGMLNKFIINEAKMQCFTAVCPPTGRFNKEDNIAKLWVGGPAGGYWTTTEDLVKFGRWLYHECQRPTFKALLERYGIEIYDKESQSIRHPGTFPSSSAFLSVSLKTGNVAAVLSDQPGVALPLGLELSLGDRVFRKNSIYKHQHQTTAKLFSDSGKKNSSAPKKVKDSSAKRDMKKSEPRTVNPKRNSQ